MKLPAGPGLIFASLVAAYLFNSLPWSGLGARSRGPTSCCVVLVFWVIHQPGSVGQGLAFALGLAMDVGDSMLLGQHALAYVIATYGAQVLRVRVLAFPILEQTLHVLGLFLGAALVIVLLNLLLGASFPGLAVALSPVLAALAVGPAHVAPLPAGAAPHAPRVGVMIVGQTLRDQRAELNVFRSRLTVAGFLALAAFGLLVVALRLAAGGAARALPHPRRGQPHLGGPGGAQPRPHPRPQRRGARGQLLRLHARDHAQQGGQRRARHRRALAGDRGEPARPPALQAPAGGEQELREPAHPHPPHRGGGREVRGEPLPLPGLRDQGAALPLLPARRHRLARGGLHRPHQRGRRAPDRGGGRSRPTTRAPTTSASSASRAPTRRSCTAPPAASRWRSTPAAAPSARSRAPSRSRATTSSSPST